jgi:peptide/nickel transport system ATP-binding protein
MTHLLDVRGLKTQFFVESGVVHAVNGISYTVDAGEALAIVGESGSGKSVGVQSIMGLIRTPPGHIAGGEVLFEGRDLLKVSNEELRQIRGNEIAMIFQDPMTSLNPVLNISIQITEALEEHRGMSRADARVRAIEMLDLVGLPNAADRIDDFPHQFSGGQLQRIGIAIALACDPSLLIADEPTTALDVTIQAQIVELVVRLQKQLGMAIIWITHDLGVVAGMVDKVAVMYAGHIVELAPVLELYDESSHPYTIGLLESIPSIEMREERLVPIEGTTPSLLVDPTSCPFAPRCSFAVERCWQENPPLREIAPQHFAACWQWEEARALGESKFVDSVTVISPETTVATEHDIILEVRDLKKHFPIMRGVFRRQVGAVKAVDGVSFQVRRGETLGLVGRVT